MIAAGVMGAPRGPARCIAPSGTASSFPLPTRPAVSWRLVGGCSPITCARRQVQIRHSRRRNISIPAKPSCSGKAAYCMASRRPDRRSERPGRCSWSKGIPMSWPVTRQGFRGGGAPRHRLDCRSRSSGCGSCSRSTQKVPVVCFDGDAAGMRAARSACEKILPLLKPNRSALFAFLPPGEDPDTLIARQGRAAFQAVLERALPLDQYLWHLHTAGQRFETPEAQAGLEEAVLTAAGTIQDQRGHLNRKLRFCMRG